MTALEFWKKFSGHLAIERGDACPLREGEGIYGSHMTMARTWWEKDYAALPSVEITEVACPKGMHVATGEGPDYYIVVACYANKSRSKVYVTYNAAAPEQLVEQLCRQELFEEQPQSGFNATGEDKK